MAGGTAVVLEEVVVPAGPVVAVDWRAVVGAALLGAWVTAPGGTGDPAPFCAAGAGDGAKPTAAAVSRRPWQPPPHDTLAVVSRMRCTAWAALRPSDRKRATVPVTCGVAIDVP